MTIIRLLYADFIFDAVGPTVCRKSCCLLLVFKSNVISNTLEIVHNRSKMLEVSPSVNNFHTGVHASTPLVDDAAADQMNAAIRSSTSS